MNVVNSRFPEFGSGIYSVTEAARIAGVRPSTAARWFSDKSGSFLKHEFSVDDERAVSFLDLVEVFTIGRLRALGVRLQVIRRAREKMAAVLGVDHPLASKKIYTDGRSVIVAEAREDREQELECPITNQLFISGMEPYLAHVKYGRDSMASQFIPHKHVLVDPKRKFGQPIGDKSFVPTYILAMQFFANGEDAEIVSQCFDSTPAEVLAAVEWEKHLKTVAA